MRTSCNDCDDDIPLATDVAPSALPQTPLRSMITDGYQPYRPTRLETSSPNFMQPQAPSPYDAGMPGLVQWLAHVYPDLYDRLRAERPDILQNIAALSDRASNLQGLGDGDVTDFWSSVSSIGDQVIDWAGKAASVYDKIKSVNVSNQVSSQVQRAATGQPPAALPNAQTGAYPQTPPPSSGSLLSFASGGTILAIGAVAGLIWWLL